MINAEFRRRAHALLEKCVIRHGEMLTHALHTELQDLLAAGPQEVSGTVQAQCGCAWLRDAQGYPVQRLMSCPNQQCTALPERLRFKKAHGGP